MTPELIAWLVLTSVPLNVLVVYLLWQTYRPDPTIKVLRRDLEVMVVVTLTVAVFGLIFVNNDQPSPPLDLAATKIITRLVLLGLAYIPALTWLLLRWRRGL